MDTLVCPTCHADVANTLWEDHQQRHADFTFTKSVEEVSLPVSITIWAGSIALGVILGLAVVLLT